MVSRSDFIKFFILVYIANICASGSGYSIFALGKSLGLMGASSTFIIFALDISRFTTIICMILLRQKSDTISKQKMSLWGGVITFIAFFCLAFSSGWVWILSFCLMFGIANSMLAYLGAIMLDRVEPAKRMTTFGYFATSYSFSSLVGAYLNDLFYPFGIHGATTGFPQMNTWSFFNPLNIAIDTNPNFMMMSGAAMGVIWIITTIWSRKFEKKLPFYGAISQADKEFKPTFKTYRVPTGLTLLMGIVWMTLMALIPGFAHKHGIENTSAFFLTFALLAVFGRFFILPHINEWGRRQIIYIAFFCYATAYVCILLIPYYPNAFVLLLAGMFCGIGHGIIYTVLSLLFAEITPKHTGNATFIFTILFQIGCLLVLPIGIFVDFLGYLPVFYGILIFQVTILIISMFKKDLQILLKGQKGGHLHELSRE